MKLIDHNTLKTCEQKLIDLIVLNLNWKSIRKAIKSHFNIKILKDVTIDSGDLVILNNEIAFKLNMGPQTGVAMLLDRSGNLIKISSSESLNVIKEKLSKPEEEIAEEQTALEDASVMTSEISALISKINEANQPKANG